MNEWMNEWMNILRLGKRLLFGGNCSLTAETSWNVLNSNKVHPKKHPCELQTKLNETYPQKPRNIPKSVLVTLFRDVLGAFQWQRYLQEFISGCLRLQGAARAVDLLLMTKDTRRGRHWMLGNMKWLHPARLTWNLQITHLERKMIFQTSMTMFHVNLHECISNRVAWIRMYDRQWCNMHVCIFSTSCFCRIVLSYHVVYTM